MKVRKKPVEVEALQWNGEEERFREIQELAKDSGRLVNRNARLELEIPTLEGVMTADLEDFIIKGVNGEVYPCKPDIFRKTYDVINTVQERAVAIKHLTFGEALHFLQQGSAMARKGWNGKGMFAFMMQGDMTTAADIMKNPAIPKAVNKYYTSLFAHHAAEAERGKGPDSMEVPINPYFCLVTAQGSIAQGWRPTTVDLLADDWFIAHL